MANRIILGAVLTVVLILTPSFTQATPTQDSQKKSSTKAKTIKSKSAKKTRSSKRSASPGEESPVKAEMFSNAASASKSTGVAETPPLMRVIPQRDGRFLLEPLSPQKPAGQISRPTSQLPPAPHPAREYNLFEPWNFSDLVLSQAKHYQDTPYCRGGSLTTGYATDCSGFVQYIYQGFKIDLPRSSAEQAQVGKVVTQSMDFSKLLPGDLLFFSRGGRHIGHAGIYLGEGKMIHASNRRNGVIVTDLRQSYYEGTFVVAKRVFEVKYP